MNYLFNPRVQLTILVLLFVVVVVSILKNPANMSQNLIAEAAGIVLGVWLTVTFVERMLERRRRQKWEEVRSQVFRAISSHISDITTDYMVYLGDGFGYLDKVIEGRSKATIEAADAMVAALEDMRKVHSVAGVQELFQETEWDFSRLRDVLTPRLIEFGEAPKLIQLLIEIDDRRVAWKNHLIIEERVSAGLEGAFDAAIDTLEALIRLYKYLATG